MLFAGYVCDGDYSWTSFFTILVGKQLQAIKLPARRITSCCWGGKNLDELFVTCARYGITEEEKVETPLAGSVFRVTGLSYKGKPAYIY